MENLANCYLRDVLKQQCWDSMSVKGRAIKVTSTTTSSPAFPNNSLSPESTGAQYGEKLLQFWLAECLGKKLLLRKAHMSLSFSDLSLEP